jgi:hypothetical protein
MAGFPGVPAFFPSHQNDLLSFLISFAQLLQKSMYFLTGTRLQEKHRKRFLILIPAVYQLAGSCQPREE